MKTIKTTLLVAFAGAGILFSAASHAYLRDVAIQLRQATSGEVVTYTLFGDLRNGQAQNLRIHLEAGVPYTIAGACDRDCPDLDLKLYDENGNFIDKDISIDSIPVVSVTPRRTADFTLRVVMARCDANPCSYGVATIAE